MDIKGFNGLYQISDDGTKVLRKGYWITQKNQHGEYKRYMKPKECKVCIDNEGYYSVALNGKHHRLHRLIYEAFVGDIPDGFVIDHKNGNKLDNSLDNIYEYDSSFFEIFNDCVSNPSKENITLLFNYLSSKIDIDYKKYKIYELS